MLIENFVINVAKTFKFVEYEHINNIIHLFNIKPVAEQNMFPFTTRQIKLVELHFLLLPSRLPQIV